MTNYSRGANFERTVKADLGGDLRMKEKA